MSIRFMPDDLREAILRPVAMAAPDGAVYVEFIAPDFRFVFVLLLVAAWLLLRGWRWAGPRTPWILLVVTALAFVPWLATSGNGRYFLPFLLVVGPLCIGLAQQLPTTRAMRLALAVAMVGLQVFLVHEITPFRSWSFVHWGDGPAFPVEVPQRMREQPGTYVGLSNLSYSIIAPQFHPQSRWINLSQLRGDGASPLERRAEAFLREDHSPRLVFPSLAIEDLRDPMDLALETAINDLLARHTLSVADASRCTLLPAPGIAGVARRSPQAEEQENPSQFGFWVCPLAHRASSEVATEAASADPREEAVFRKLEAHCPRLFHGGAKTLRIPAGALRGYASSDFKLYVLSNGTVMYKYMRALNPVVLGTVDAVLAGKFSLDCGNVRGRGGLPWEREI